MCSQPLFVAGSPRSGTTFLGMVLNRHPSIQIINETRVFVLLKDMIDIRSRNQWMLEKPFQQHWAAYARRHAGAWVEGFYREELGITAPIWGDKHPHYADPAVLAGEAARIPGATAGSCLRLIRDCLPTAKFIHIHRDPRQVAHSLSEKKWVPTPEAGVAVWCRHINEIQTFFAEINPTAHHTVPYAGLRQQPEQAASAIARFLGLDDPATMTAFLLQQRANPTPFSVPVTDLTRPPPGASPDEAGDRLLTLAAPFATALGYTPAK